MHLLHGLHRLLLWWSASLQHVPAAVPAVLRRLLPLSQQLQRCSAQLLGLATGPAGGAGACTLFNVNCALGLVVYLLYTPAARESVVAADALGLQHEAAVAEMQLQVLAGWTAELHKDHVAHQQPLQQELPVAAAESSSCSSKHSSSHPQQQQQRLLLQPRQPAKQQWRTDLLSIPAFHQDMLPLPPGGQAYLDTAGRATFAGVESGGDRAIEIHEMANSCCCILIIHMQYILESLSGQQGTGGSAVLVSAAAVRLLLELQLLAAGAVQRQHHQQQQQTLTSRRRHVKNALVVNCRKLLALLIKALVVSSRSCLPPAVLQQAGLQLLQALAAPLQQLQLSAPGDSFYDDVASTGALTSCAKRCMCL
jgi:hypothetical protein